MKWSTNSDKDSVGEPQAETTGRPGTPGLCTLGNQDQRRTDTVGVSTLFESN